MTTFLSQKIQQLGISEVCSYLRHPHRVNMVDNLNPKLLRKLHFLFVDNIYQGQEGVMLVPPMTGNSIYIASSSGYTDFDRDVYFNELIRKGNVNDYAMASYKTLVPRQFCFCMLISLNLEESTYKNEFVGVLASSRIWPHEEEILSYRYLILHQFPSEDIKRGKDRVWLLDEKKLQKDALKNLPSQEYIDMVINGIRNIDTKQGLYVFQGDKRQPNRAIILQNMSMRIFKVGHPTDGLTFLRHIRSQSIFRSTPGNNWLRIEPLLPPQLEEQMWYLKRLNSTVTNQPFYLPSRRKKHRPTR